MGMKIRMDVSAFKQQLKASADKLHAATKPAAHAGAFIIYERARILVPESAAAHKFYGQNAVYGPYSPGNLRDSIYRVFSKDNSFRDVSTYHVSWNASKAPAHSFIGRAVTETRAQVREAMKERFIAEVNK